jgi:hypothetical protein
MTPHDYDHDYIGHPTGLHVEEVIGILRETLEYLGPVTADEPHAAWGLRKRVQDALDALRPPTPIPTSAVPSATLHDDAEGHAR